VIAELDGAYQPRSRSSGKGKFGKVRGQDDNSLSRLVTGDGRSALLAAGGEKQCYDEEDRD
jgi:hypothetical protein